jgi:transglutaminase-like putative cysteine protease
MHRRTVLAGAAAPLISSLFSGPSFAQARAGDGWRRWEVTTRVDLAATAEPAELWIPLAESVGDYQRALAPRFDSNGRAELVRDAHYRAPMLRVRWQQPGAHAVTLVQTVETRDRTLDPETLSAAEQRFWTQPVRSLPTGGLVKETADRIVSGVDQPRARLRAIYDWVVDNTFRDPATRGCGTGGIENLLETGYLGGKCADINSLMVGLARAAGIPARDAYGVRLGPSAFVKQLGASGDVSHAQHCRAEMWIAGEGWLPVDPADVRKVVLEAKLPVDSPEVRAQRERLFGSWEMNWMVYNHATDIALPGAPRPMEENFLMYPCAMTPKGELDQLDPAGFRYSITSKQIVA